MVRIRRVTARSRLCGNPATPGHSSLSSTTCCMRSSTRVGVNIVDLGLAFEVTLADGRPTCG